MRWPFLSSCKNHQCWDAVFLSLTNFPMFFFHSVLIMIKTINEEMRLCGRGLATYRGGGDIHQLWLFMTAAPRRNNSLMHSERQRERKLSNTNTIKLSGNLIGCRAGTPRPSYFEAIMRVIIPSWVRRKGARVSLRMRPFVSEPLFGPARPNKQTAQCFNKATEISSWIRLRANLWEILFIKSG